MIQRRGWCFYSFILCFFLFCGCSFFVSVFLYSFFFFISSWLHLLMFSFQINCGLDGWILLFFHFPFSIFHFSFFIFILKYYIFVLLQFYLFTFILHFLSFKLFFLFLEFIHEIHSSNNLNQKILNHFKTLTFFLSILSFSSFSFKFFDLEWKSK